MEQYHPGDEVIRTKFGKGMIGKIIRQKCELSYMVEVLTVTRGERYSRVGNTAQWGSHFFVLLRPANREPDWER